MEEYSEIVRNILYEGSTLSNVATLDSQNSNIQCNSSVLLGFLGTSENDVRVCLYIGGHVVSDVNVSYGCFVPALDGVTYLPAYCISNYRMHVQIEPYDARVGLVITEVLPKETDDVYSPWKHVRADGTCVMWCKETDLSMNVTNITEPCAYMPNVATLPRWNEHLESYIDGWKMQTTAERVNVILRDLIEKTWEPSRHMKWCLDHEELKDFD